MADEAQRSLANDVAAIVLNLHQKVGPRGGSLAHNGALEWTCLAGVCLVIGNEDDTRSVQIVPISLATGTKTLSYLDVKKGQGDIAHDSHAEVLARRAARRWLAERMVVESKNDPGLQEIEQMPRVFEWRSPSVAGEPGCRLKDNVKVWWYVSTTPCGSCSMPYAVRKRQREDGLEQRERSVETTHRSCAVTRGTTADGQMVPTLRTVPGRGDAPPSLSHSCSDKLLLWSLIGWQGSMLAYFLEPPRIDGIVISAPDPTEDTQQLEEDVRAGLDVAARLGGTTDIPALARDARMEEARLRPPQIFITTQSFSQSQSSVRKAALSAGAPEDRISPAWGAMNWIRPSYPHKKEVESLVNGIRRGAPFKRVTTDGKTFPLTDKARSRLCKLEWYRCMVVLSDAMSRRSLGTPLLTGSTYGACKCKGESDPTPTDLQDGRQLYRLRKAVLRGPDLDAKEQEEAVEAWLSNLPTKAELRRRKGRGSVYAEDQRNTSPKHDNRYPLQGWLTTPASLEAFDIDGIREK